MRLNPLLIGIFCVITFPKDCFSQLDHIQVLIGRSESSVINYMDSLNRLRPNSAFKIKRDANNYGDLILSCEFSLYDEKFYKCSYLIFVFKRLDTGEEMCRSEGILGSIEYTSYQLNFIKDNFTFVSDNTWEQNISVQLKVVATFKRMEGQYPTFNISYDLAPK